MRTTLTLDDDVAEKLQDLAHRQRLPFKRVVNDVLRRGLSAQAPRSRTRTPYRVKPFRSAQKRCGRPVTRSPMDPPPGGMGKECASC